MSKLDCGKDESHQEWMLKQDCHCCYIHMSAFREKHHSSFFLGALSEADDLWYTWRGRLKVAWSALKGQLICHDIEFYTAEHVAKFITEVKEVSDWTFGSSNCQDE